ncbi:MAG: hypothetical protein NT148_00400 [Candidatus Nealsonbacteria bacterium]|nr:hypothetical protein [Candidatus Nealsonbacteria bacterium]
MKIKKLLYLTLLIAIFAPAVSFAVSIPNPLTTSDFQTLINRLIDLVFTIGLALAPIAIIIAGILFMTAQGEPGKIQTAQNIIKWTFIGLIILICSKAIVSLIQTTIGVK